MLKIDRETCIGCGACAGECFYGKISMVKGKARMAPFDCWNCEHCIGLCPVGAISDDAADMSQVTRYNRETFSVSPENLLNLIRFRRSIRMFRPDPAEDETLLSLLEAGRYSPTGGNRQELSYIILKERLPEIRDMAIETFGALVARNDDEEISRAFNGNMSYKAYWKRGYQDYRETGKDGLFYNAPTVIVVTGPKDEMSLIDAGIATSNIELLAVAQGLGVCYIAFFQMACQVNPDIEKAIGIGERDSILAVMAVGRPALQFHSTVPRNPVRAKLM